MTRELDEAHREAMPRLQAETAQLGANLRDQLARTGLDRRRFVVGIGALGAGLALAGCGSSGSGSGDQGAPAVSPAPTAPGYTGDLKIIAFAAALENQAAAAYQVALEAAGKGKLGKVPPAFGTFSQTVMTQHSEHAENWNQLLKTSGVPEVNGVPLSTDQQTVAAFTAAKDVGAVAKLALGLEDQAASTYLFSMGGFSDKAGGAIGSASIIAPVEAMHSAILRFILGEYPVPNAFTSAAGAAKLATFTG